MPTGTRPDKKINKILYKIMKTPKSLQQDNKADEIPKRTLDGWIKESLPTKPGIY